MQSARQKSEYVRRRQLAYKAAGLCASCGKRPRAVSARTGGLIDYCERCRESRYHAYKRRMLTNGRHARLQSKVQRRAVEQTCTVEHGPA